MRHTALRFATNGLVEVIPAATISADLAQAGFPPPRPQLELARAHQLPPWLGDERLHRSHQAALVRKDSAFYAALFPNVDPELPYFWPVDE